MLRLAAGSELNELSFMGCAAINQKLWKTVADATGPADALKEIAQFFRI